MFVRLTKAALAGYLALALLGGLAIGAGLLVWQRASVSARIDEAERRVDDARREVRSATGQLKDLQARLDSAEASLSVSEARRSKLASDLAETRGRPATSGGSGSSSVAISVISRGVAPSTVESGKPLQLEAKVKGKPDVVKMRLVARAGGFDKTYRLSRVSISGETQTWRATVNAPGTAGEYRYYATAYRGSKKYEMPGVSAWIFMVE